MTTAEIAGPTTARQRALHDLMERSVTIRRRAFIPRQRELASAAGISEGGIAFLAHLRQIADRDVVRDERLRRRLCYSAREGWRARFDELVAAGLAQRIEDGWHITPEGMDLIERTWRAIHDQLAALPLPRDAVRRTVEALERRLRAVEAGEYARLTMIRRCAPVDRERADDAVRLEQAMFETCVMLDDGHIKAWTDAGYRGPVLDVLTRVWYGTTSRGALKDALQRTQDPAQVDRHIDELVQRGDLVVDGDHVELTAEGRATRDRIESETDRLGLAHWPTGDELERITADVEAIVAALPDEKDLPTGPTH